MSNSIRRGTSTALHYEQAPQIVDTGERTWVTRASNFAIAVSEVQPRSTGTGSRSRPGRRA